MIGQEGILCAARRRAKRGIRREIRPSGDQRASAGWNNRIKRIVLIRIVRLELNIFLRRAKLFSPCIVGKEVEYIVVSEE